MNELSQNEQSVEAQGQVPSADTIQKERQALLAEVSTHNTADAERLGHVAASSPRLRREEPVAIDARGQVITSYDHEANNRYAQVHGGFPSDDTPTGR